MNHILVPIEEKDAELLIVALKMSSAALIQLRHICQGENDIQRMINILESTARYLKHDIEWHRTKRAMDAETEERSRNLKGPTTKHKLVKAKLADGAEQYEVIDVTQHNKSKEVSMKKEYVGEDSE